MGKGWVFGLPGGIVEVFEIPKTELGIGFFGTCRTSMGDCRTLMGGKPT